MDRLALMLMIVGSINWLLVGLFQLDLVATVFAGQTSFLSRIIYVLVGFSGIWSMTFLFREHKAI